MSLRDDLIRQEGWKKFPYKDDSDKLSKIDGKPGLWTIAVGHCIESDPDMMMHFTKLQVEGMTDEEIGKLLDNDIFQHHYDLTHLYPWVENLSLARIEAMINLAFNMGINKLMMFKHFLAAMQAGQWEDAALELLYTGSNKTPYYVQVGKRAEEIAAQIKEG